MRESILVLAEEFKDQIAEIRNVQGWKVAPHQEKLWLKGPLENGDEQYRILSLPVNESYQVDEQGRLFPTGSLTPIAVLEELDWQLLTDFIAVELPVSAMPAKLDQKMPIKLVRADRPKPNYALRVSLAVWKSYVVTAPLVRLQQLDFALSSTREVLVIGDPLPPLPGKGYWAYGQLLVPVGFDFDPPLLAELLLSGLSSDEPSYILMNETGQCTTIPAASFRNTECGLVRKIS